MQRRVDHPSADLRPGLDQCIDVIDVQVGEPILDALGQAALGDELLERERGGCEAARHGYAELAQVADHLAERGILAADLAEVGQAQLIEP